MITFRELWQRYSTQFPKDIPPWQQDAAEAAFYHGAALMFQEMRKVPPHVQDELLARFDEEIKTWLITFNE